jgi:clan AA aspartic protease
VITGIVTPFREATLQLTVRGPNHQESVETVIDTGFTDYLTLPPDLISRLGLPLGGSTRATLADGTSIALSSYRASVLWDGHWRPITVLEAAGGALAGMSLIYGFRLTIEALDGGAVTIEAMP